MESTPFAEALLPTRHDAIAPDGSQVRLLVRLPGGSMAHFELGPGEVSRPAQHRTVSEAWYMIQGLGRMWRRQDGTEREIDLRPGTGLTIPVGTAFQFCTTGREPLAAVGVTMPPWPGEDEAMDVVGDCGRCATKLAGPTRTTRVSAPAHDDADRDTHAGLEVGWTSKSVDGTALYAAA